MSLNFKYISYDKRFYTDFIKNEYVKSDEHLFVFLDNRMKDNFSRKFGNNLFAKNPTFVTFDEFKERIFFTNKIVLKEAKRILAFLKSIPEDIKEELDITTYFDIIDLGNSFFSYYKDLKLSCNEEFENPQNWQKKYLEYFVKIKENFDKIAKKYGYIPSDWLEDYKNFTDEWVSRFKMIVFVDIVEYPKLYQKILKELGKKQDITLVLQMDKNDFDEEKMQIKKISLPKFTKLPEVYTFNSTLESALSLIKLNENNQGYIYSPDVENNYFHEVFPNNFQRSRRYTMNDTKLFNFLNVQYQLLYSGEESLEHTYLLSEFLIAFGNKVFQEYYELTQEDYKNLNIASKEGYKYISKKIIEGEWFEKNIDWKTIERLKHIIYDLEQIYIITNVESLYSYFKEVVNLEKFLEEDFDNKDLLEKFLEIFGMIKSNESLKIYKSSKEFLGQRIGEGFYRLLIQYMKDIVIKSNIKSQKEVPIIKPFDFVRYAEHDENIYTYFIDVTDKYFPKGIYDKSIFTESQKKELGIFTYEQLREVEKYRFYQGVASKKNVVIFTMKDEENQIGISPFLEEIILENKIEIKSSPVAKDSILNILNSIFIGENTFIQEKTDNYFKKPENLTKLTLGAYDIGVIDKCPLMFYFSKIKNLDYIKPVEAKDLDPRILGIVVHNVLENIGKSLWKDILKGNKIEIEIERVEEELRKAFYYERDKIMVHMDNYVKDILIPLISKNIMWFFNLLNREYVGNKITRFQSEKGNYENSPYYSGKIDVYLKGRADLVIESDRVKRIIDYKTGSATDGQLDYYSILLYGDENSCQKDIFNVWNGRVENVKKVQLSKEKLDSIIKNFVENIVFSVSQKESYCKDCIYQNICRRDKNEQEDNIES